MRHNIIWGIFLGAFTIFVAANIYLTQAVVPLFFDLVYESDKESAATFLKTIENDKDYPTQLAYYKSLYGDDINNELVKEQTLNNQQISYYTNLLKKNPQARDVLIKLALLHNSVGNTKESQEYYRKAKEIDPALAITELQ